MTMVFRGEQTGSAMVVVMILMIFLFALAAAMTMTSMVGIKATLESDRGMRAFYLADSGAQVGIAMVRAAGGTADDSSFIENISGGNVSVLITKQSPALYQVRSDSNYAGYLSAVEVYVRFSGSFKLPGGYTVMFSRGVALRANSVATSILGNSTISGMDHDPDGSLLADQTEAVAGLAMNTVPGKRKFSVDGSGPLIEGSPDAINNKAADISSVLKSVRDYAKDYADVKLTGSRFLGSADTGDYGTSTHPKLVYTRLEDNGTLALGEDFQGYGTLVIETNNATTASVLEMRDFASWQGLVVIYLSGAAEVSGGTLVRMSDDSKIIGGLSMFLNTQSTDIKGLGNSITAPKGPRFSTPAS